MSPRARSAFEVVAKLDTWPYYEDDPEEYMRALEDFYQFFIEGVAGPVGLVHHSVVDAMTWPACWDVIKSNRQLRLHCPTTFEGHTAALEETLWQGHLENASPSLKVWHNERFPVYSNSGEHLLDVDGSGVDIIGARSAAVYLIAWTNAPQGQMYWVQKRGFNKTLLPGRLDMAVSGRLGPNELPFEGMIREVGEEANLPASLLRERLVQRDALGVAYTQSNQGKKAYQYQTLYVFEIELDADTILSCDTDEVADHFLMSLDQIRQGIDEETFIPAAQIVYVSHFIRLGIFNSQNEPRLAETLCRMHRRHQLFMPPE